MDVSKDETTETTTDDQTERLIQQMIEMDLNEMQSNMTGSSTDTLEQVQQRLSEQITSMKQKEESLKKQIKERKKEDDDYVDKQLNVIVCQNGINYLFTVKIDSDTTVGQLRKKVLKVINNVLIRLGQKKLASALARSFSISINDKDWTNNGRKTLKLIGVSSNSGIVVTIPHNIANKFFLPVNLQADMMEQDNDDEQEDEEEVEVSAEHIEENDD